MIFIIEKECFDQCDIKSFCEAIDRAGHVYTFINTKNAHEILSTKYNSQVLYYGGLNRANWLLHYGAQSIWNPGIVADFDLLDCQNYLYNWPRNIFINSDFKISDNLPEKSLFPLFIRPCSAMKPFTGKVFNSAEEFTESIQSGIVYASPKKIVEEYRIVIVSGKVITGTSYILGSEINTGLSDDEVPVKIYNFAKQVLNQAKVPYGSYVLDIGVLDNGIIGVVELNAISTSGLYNINYTKFVSALEKIMCSKEHVLFQDTTVSKLKM